MTEVSVEAHDCPPDRYTDRLAGRPREALCIRPAHRPSSSRFLLRLICQSYRHMTHPEPYPQPFGRR